MFTARKQLARAMANSVVISKRASVKLRMEKFVAHAKKVMLISFLYTAAVGLFMLVVGVCQSCWTSIWVYLPIFFLLSNVYQNRSAVVSLRTSYRHRNNLIPHHTTQKNEKNSSAEVMNSPQSPIVPRASRKVRKPVIDVEKLLSSTSSLSSREVAVSSSNKLSNPKKQSKGSRFMKIMSVVQEADYEGTVVTQTESAFVESNPAVGGNNESPRAAIVSGKHFQIGEGISEEEREDRSSFSTGKGNGTSASLN
jgi:hypothetical protein